MCVAIGNWKKKDKGMGEIIEGTNEMEFQWNENDYREKKSARNWFPKLVLSI